MLLEDLSSRLLLGYSYGAALSKSFFNTEKMTSTEIKNQFKCTQKEDYNDKYNFFRFENKNICKKKTKMIYFSLSLVSLSHLTFHFA